MNENFNNQENLNNNYQAMNNYNSQPTQPMQPEIDDDFKDIKNNKLIIFIIILILLLAGVGIGIFFILNKSKDPQSIFKESLNEVKKQFNTFTDSLTDNLNFTKADKVTIKNNITFDTDLKELEELKNYELNFITQMDYKNKYANFELILGTENKEIVNLMTYLFNNQQFLETDLFSKTIKIGEYEFDELFKQENNENINQNIEDYKYMFNQLIDYINNSFVEEKFEKTNEKINVNNKELNATANTYILDSETINTMKNSIIDKILADEKFIDLLVKYGGENLTKEEIIKSLKENKNQSIDDTNLTAGKSEAEMILSGINSYCATSELKAMLDDTYVDICADGVTIDEVDTMINLGNAKISKITYQKEVTELIVENNGYTFTLQNDGSFKEEKNDTYEDISKAIIYTYKNKFVGFKLINNDETINYTSYENIDTLNITEKDNTILTGKYQNNELTVSIINDNEEITLNYNKDNKTANLTLKSDENIINTNLKFVTNKINDNETNIKTNINLTISTPEESANFKINIDTTEYVNKDIEINKPNSYIELDEITEQDYQEILTNLYKNVEGTSLEEVLYNLLMSSNDSLYNY